MGGFADAGTFGQWRRAVNVVKADAKTSRFGSGDKTSSHLRREGLTAFVVADVPLGTTKVISHRLLRDTEALSDWLQVVHTRIIAPLHSLSISPLF